VRSGCSPKAEEFYIFRAPSIAFFANQDRQASLTDQQHAPAFCCIIAPQAGSIMPAINAITGLFSTLPKHFSTLLFANAKSIHLPPNQALFLTDDPGDGCYRIEKGILKVTMVSPSGTERILAILAAGDIVGELAVLDGLPRSASVFTLRASEVLFVSRSKFYECADKHPELYRHLLMVLASRLRDTNDVIAAESFLRLQGRVALTLIELAQHFGEQVEGGRMIIQESVSEADLAAMAGIARDKVDSILADWKERKIITQVAGHYCIENESALQNEIHQ
jgi:CRP-like cAMP-binding protein